MLAGTPNKLLYMGFIGGGPGNQNPVANFTFTCNASHTCTFTSTSTDSDGTIVSTVWKRVNTTGNLGTGSPFTKTFAKSGTLQIRLTVTDNQGGTGTIVKAVAIP